MHKYIIDVFTPEYEGTQFPVNTYTTKNKKELSNIVSNCLKEKRAFL